MILSIRPEESGPTQVTTSSVSTLFTKNCYAYLSSQLLCVC